ncbi:hypothetical protein Asppvi_009542 [Aspergillus pseudoviridinutans]|uniref:Uncharacterized protein n=1 Tax=Aspergillus pseudoviridinutans TaxID=1517512 RepID=A0A9P3BKF2_9EURO|nr:uncharacterized protein Asppvi_009542 [Aspergillus pseudoviridinutans]GIJ90583.1 hypothetical protein Asppvi_009542 [Aspergillus pseudoviridinutans]
MTYLRVIVKNADQDLSEKLDEEGWRADFIPVNTVNCSEEANMQCMHSSRALGIRESPKDKDMDMRDIQQSLAWAWTFMDDKDASMVVNGGYNRNAPILRP